MPEPEAKTSSGHDDTVPAVASDGPTVEAAPPADVRYRLGNELGRGGMGRVVEAFDTHLGRTVALKEVLEGGGASMVRRFKREVRITARLEHASIVPLYDSGLMHDGRPFYVMRRVSGRPLDELISSARDLDHRLALLPNVLAAIDAIAHAHRRGVIHRDLKPANILVGDLGETVVIDWGLAKVIDEDDPEPDSLEPRLPSDSLKTQVGSVFGTPGFMAPEQARGEEPSPRSDVFALGATLYQLLAGKPPVRGNSATEVIASTMKLRILPLETACPGAPAELVTIIQKALAFDAAQRYATAGDLAEDVRRFTTGQLVGAHRYTAIQRFLRFARRHRAALSIAAAAMTVLAALSWFSVHRIVQERDAANAARSEAEVQRALAKNEAERASKRADQLLVSHARTLLDANPTAAVAILEHITTAKPPLADEIAGLTQAAMTRGVAWGLPTLPGMITSFEMTRDGRRLFELDRQGRLQLFDLDRREAVMQKEIAGSFQATWIDNDSKLFMLRSKQPPALFDPAANTVDAIDVAMRDYVKSADGKRLAYIDATGVGIFDLETRKATSLWTGKAGDALAFSSDGNWVAFVDKPRKRWLVVERTGKVLVDQPGEASAFATSKSGQLGVLVFGQRVVEIRPADVQPAFVTIPVDASDLKAVHLLSYQGDKLVMYALRNLLTWNGKAITRSMTFEGGVLFSLQSANDVLVTTANDFNVHVLRGPFHIALPLTQRPEGFARIAASPNSSRIAATATDAVLVWNLDGLLPREIRQPYAVFVGPHTIWDAPGAAAEWDFWDLSRDVHDRVVPEIIGMTLGYQIGEDGRLLVNIQSGEGPAKLLLSADLKRQLAIKGSGLAVLVPGDGLVYSQSNRIFGKLGAANSRELVTLDGDGVALAANGPLGYAALSKTGELVRGSFGGDNFARTQVKDLAPDAFIVCNPDHDVLIASGNRLLRWHGDVVDVARFTDRIETMTATETGTFVGLSNRELHFLSAHGDQTPRRVPINGGYQVVDHGKRVVGLSASAQLEIVDAPGLTKWALPKLYSASNRFSVSPDGRRLLQSTGFSSVLWTLPQTLPPLTALTNATDEDGGLHWPWQ
jgi:aminoglycoside phosphotransferase (APT) family kinase protein